MQGYPLGQAGCTSSEKSPEKCKSAVGSLPHVEDQSVVVATAAIATTISTPAPDDAGRCSEYDHDLDNVHAAASDTELHRLSFPFSRVVVDGSAGVEEVILHKAPPRAASMGLTSGTFPGCALSPLSSRSPRGHREEEEEEQQQQQQPPPLTTDDILRSHRKHVFILTSSGRPIFTRYGDANALSDLFGVFQVLISIAQKSDGGGSASENLKGILRCVTAGKLCLYFDMKDELYYVLVTRTGESARSCMRQIHQLHLQLLSFLPNVGNILTHCPSYDLRRLISPADARIVQQLIKRNSHEECYLFRCLTAAPLSVAQRRWLQGLLKLRRVAAFARGEPASRVPNAASATLVEEEEDEGVGCEDGVCEEENRLFSFFFFRGRVVCAVGPADSDASLHIDDALLLLNFTRCLAHTQDGEVWAPVCLPMYNNTGYLWCYCVNVSVMARNCRRGRIVSLSSAPAPTELTDRLGEEGNELLLPPQPPLVRSGSPACISGMEGGAFVAATPPEYTKSDGLLLVHIATTQGAFGALAERSYRIARQLTFVIGPLEEMLSQRENIPLSVVLADAGGHHHHHNRQQRQQQEELARLFLLAEQQQEEPEDHDLNPSAFAATLASSFSPPVFMHPDGLQWFAVVLRGKKLGDKGVANIVYSEPSPAMRLSARERKRQLRLVVKLRDELAELSQSPEPLLLVNMKEINAVVMRPTSTLVASLVEQFCTAPSHGTQAEGRRGSSSASVEMSEAAAACGRVQELMLLFLPHIPKPRMLGCAMRVLVRIAELEDEFSFEQVRGC